jgi:hypothetical protein
VAFILPAKHTEIYIDISSSIIPLSVTLQIRPESIKRLLLSPAFTSSFRRVSAIHGLKFPLKFSSALDELNFISTLSLLNFASGYRIPLHTASGRGAWDSIRAFVLSLYLASSSDGVDLLSAKAIQAIETMKVAELMNLNVHVEQPHESIPGITIGKLGGPLYDLVKLITATLNETGECLIRMGYPNLGSFVAEALKESAKAEPVHDGNAMLEVVLERVRLLHACTTSI